MFPPLKCFVDRARYAQLAVLAVLACVPCVLDHPNVTPYMDMVKGHGLGLDLPGAWEHDDVACETAGIRFSLWYRFVSVCRCTITTTCTDCHSTASLIPCVLMLVASRLQMPALATLVVTSLCCPSPLMLYKIREGRVIGSLS